MAPLLVPITLASMSAGAALPFVVVDPLVKVFADVPLDSFDGGFQAEVARGEIASWQLVVRSAGRIEGLKLVAGPLHGPDGGRLPRPRVRIVGLVDVDRSMGTPATDRLRPTPAVYPDPLLPELPATLEPNATRSFWIDVKVPATLPAGEYRGTVTLQGSVDGAPVKRKAELVARVANVTVGKSRLWVTNWFAATPGPKMPVPQPDSDEFYAMLGRIAKNMAEHRQNVALISAINLVELRDDGSFDFSRFDRWVEVFAKNGVNGRIEGGHLGGRAGGWESQMVIAIKERKDGKTVSRNVAPDSPEADRFYSRYLPALMAHLRQKRWLGRYMQHLSDEPIPMNIGSYRQMADLVRKYAPGLKVIEATHTSNLVGAMDVWVPQLDLWHADFDAYAERQRNGDELWFYTCMYPGGEYANRFIELPLIKTRLLHWINYRYGVTGYLHWGYNQYGAWDPYEKAVVPHEDGGILPAGDAWVVYPGKDGPVDSIRWEAMRDGIADHELLCMLGEHRPKEAMRLAERLVLALDKYQTDLKQFRAVRREMLAALSGA